MIRKIYYYIKKIYESIFIPHTYVLSRAACLGKDIASLKFGEKKKWSLINMQKMRVDSFLEYASYQKRPKPEIVKPFLQRQDVFDFIVQQNTFEWFGVNKCSNIILIDSFSELTDQKFTHRKEGWSFCCNYNDINHETSFDEVFESKGLLSITEIEMKYELLFTFLTEKYPKKKIIFIHFPAHLDNRIKFKERADGILNIMLKIEEKFHNVTNLYVPISMVFPNENDDFPYHYGEKTYQAFIQEWDKKIPL